MLLALLEAASGEDGALRNILFDPALLGAERSSSIGKLYPDTKDPNALNIAKMVNRFCQAEWGCSSRDAILDNGEPAARRFKEPANNDDNPPSAPYREHRPLIVRERLSVSKSSSAYDWRLVAKAFREKGWMNYFNDDELERIC